MKAPSAALIVLALATAPAFAQSGGNLLRCVVHDAPQAGRLATCTGRVGPKQPQWTFVLVGHAPNIVTRIEILEVGRDGPRQVIDGLDLRPALVPGDGRDPGRVDFVLQDVNFDRSADLRIAVAPGGEDGVAYRWFLFDGDSGQFAPTDLLDQIRNPVVNATRKLILGAFKDERGRTGRVSFKWRDGKLEPVGALAQERTEDGRCLASHYVVRDGKFEKIRESECRPGAAPDGE
ncbi:MAG: hypothetical protein U1F37_21510 [Alphaproteobacteria bacterium]